MKKTSFAVIGILIILSLILFVFLKNSTPPDNLQAPLKIETVQPPPPTPDNPQKSKEIKSTANDTDKFEKPQPKAEKPESSATKNITEKPSENKQKQENFCTLSINCLTILNNLDMLDEEKIPYIPPNGIVLEEKSVPISEGDTVFDVLLRETKNNSIHLEFTKNPTLNSAYIEGIANLYEFDCGELSGWMYRVNGEFPQCGCSSYSVTPNDNIEWVYTCSFGKDVGGDYLKNNGSNI